MNDWIKGLFRKAEQNAACAGEPYEEHCNGYVFECKDVYLGKEGQCRLDDGRYVLSIHFDARDGIGWKLKCSQPYAVLFDFNDGGYFANDPSGFDYSELLSHLRALKADADNMEREEVFRALEEITARFIGAYFAERK